MQKNNNSAAFDAIRTFAKSKNARFLSVKKYRESAKIRNAARAHNYESVEAYLEAAQKAKVVFVKNANAHKKVVYTVENVESLRKLAFDRALVAFDASCEDLLKKGFALTENVVKKSIATCLYRIGMSVGDAFAHNAYNTETDLWTEVLNSKLCDPRWSIDSSTKASVGYRVLRDNYKQTSANEAVLNGRTVRLANVNKPDPNAIPGNLWPSFKEWCLEQRRVRGFELRAHGRYKMAERLMSMNLPFAEDLLLGHAVELVQLALQTKYMILDDAYVVLPVDQSMAKAPEQAKPCTSVVRTKSRFAFANQDDEE